MIGKELPILWELPEQISLESDWFCADLRNVFNETNAFTRQGSRLTFQFASPVASDRFDPVAKTNFSLARHLNIHCRIKSSKCSMDP